MPKVTFRDIAAAIEAAAPPQLQESYDNTGWQVLRDPDAECSGVLLCVDATPEVIAEAASSGFNMVLSHHPILFHGQKQFTGATLVQRTVMDAIRLGISLYASHTALDSASGGINTVIARRLSLCDVAPLVPSPDYSGAGLGAVGLLTEPMTAGQLVGLVKDALSVPVARCSRPADPTRLLRRVALCGGSGSEFIADAIAAGADAYITSDTRYHTFVDHAPDIFIIDIGHHEAEDCAKEIFHHIITEKFPNFAVQSATVDTNPIIYL